MGDAGEASEARLLAAGTDLRADALKVGHHGSRYASTALFIAAVQPKQSIVSVGRHNTFGHPAPSTLDYFEVPAGFTPVKILLTDGNGPAFRITLKPADIPSAPAPAAAATP
jgi:competence protein ComEC